MHNTSLEQCCRQHGQAAVVLSVSLKNLWDAVQCNEHVHWPDDYGITVVH